MIGNILRFGYFCAFYSSGKRLKAVFRMPIVSETSRNVPNVSECFADHSADCIIVHDLKLEMTFHWLKLLKLASLEWSHFSTLQDRYTDRRNFPVMFRKVSGAIILREKRLIPSSEIWRTVLRTVKQKWFRKMSHRHCDEQLKMHAEHFCRCTPNTFADAILPARCWELLLNDKFKPNDAD